MNYSAFFIEIVKLLLYNLFVDEKDKIYKKLTLRDCMDGENTDKLYILLPLRFM